MTKRSAALPVMALLLILLLSSLAAVPVDRSREPAQMAGSGARSAPLATESPFSDLGGQNEPVLFFNVSPEAGLSPYGGNFFDWGDYDRDGYQDLLVDGRRLLRNSGPPGWTFTDVTAQVGLDRYPGVNTGIWGDYDNDGDLDVYLAGGGWSTTTPTRSDYLLRNDGPPDYGFTDATGIAGGVVDDYPSVAAAWGDINGDGWLDLYVANYENAEMTANWPDTLWRSDGDGTFTDVSQSSGIRASGTEPGRSVSFSDYDSDGDMDIYVGNYRLRPNFLWRNDGTGHFTNVAAQAGVQGVAHYYQGYGPYYGHTIGAAWADWNNDGLMDLWQANLVHKYSGPGDIRGEICDDSRFYRANGPPAWDLTDVRASTGIPTKPVGGWGTYIGDELYSGIAWADVDNDGDLDVFMPQVYGDLSYAFSGLYVNLGDGTFADMGPDYGLRVWDTYGSAWADYDNDGDSDLVTGGKSPFSGGEYQIHLFRNSGNSNNWLKLSLEGTASNRDALGSRVTVTVGNTTMTRDVEGSTSSHGQMNDLPVEFGLGRAARADTVIVHFTSGTEIAFVDVAANQTLVVREPDAGATPQLSLDAAFPYEDQQVSLSTSDSAVASGTYTGYYWDTDGDGVFEVRTATPSADTSWPSSGERNVRLGVAREVGGLSFVALSRPVTVTVVNKAPVADAGGAVTIVEDEVRTLDGSRSGDTPSDLATLSFRWTVDGVDRGWAASPNTTVSWPQKGTHAAMLEVEDDDGAVSQDTVDITVMNLPPVVIPPQDVTVDEDQDLQIKATATDTPSDRDFLAYRVDYGDGNVTGWMGKVDRTYVYQTAGPRVVRIDARDADGAVGSATFNVTVRNVPPTAELSVKATTVDEGANVSVYGSISDTFSDSDGLKWRYDFGDGTSTDWHAKPVARLNHAYDRAGTYNISLWVVDDDGDMGSAVHTIEVRNVAPTCILLGPSGAVKEDMRVSFHAEPADTVADLATLSLEWDFGDGLTLGPTTEREVTHAYPEKGTYMVKVTVRDDNGAQGQATVPVQVDNVAPTASASASKTRLLEDERVTLDASESMDTPSDAPNLTYEWDVGGGKVVQGRLITWSWPKAGKVTVVLTVTDGDGATSEAYLPIEVVNKAPVAVLTASAMEARVGEKVTFTAAGLDDTPSDLRNLTIIWDMGDGTILTGPSVTHAFGSAGDHTVMLTVRDDDGAKVERVVTVTVTEEASALSGPAMMYAASLVVVLVVAVIALLVLRRRKRPKPVHGTAPATVGSEGGPAQGEVG
jgi:PKD repeat protein